MTQTLLYSLGAVGVVSAVSLFGIFALSISETILRRIIFVLVSVAAGAMLGDAFIHLIPESFSNGLFVNVHTAALFVIGGMLLFFVLEKFLHWRHEHGEEVVVEYEEYEREESVHEPHPIRPIGIMVLISDGVHNFIDGVIIAASFLVSIEVGIATTIAVILHEIPQEIGDFGLLIHSGFSRVQALFLNFMSAITSFAGVLVTFAFGIWAEHVISYAIPFAAGALIYIATADIIPELHKTKRMRFSLIQIVGICVGVLAMYMLVIGE